MDKTTLRPGILVVMRTSIVNNVTYEKTIIQSEHLTDEGTEEASWETKRVVKDPAEFELAKRARADAAAPLRRVCVQTSFGMLCPKDLAQDLDAAVKESRAAVDAFNGVAKLTCLKVFILCGVVADNDVEAVRAISNEIQDLISEMKDGIENVDPTRIRVAATRAKALGRMMSGEAAEKVRNVVDAAREAATRIVKAGEQAAQEVDKQSLHVLELARTAFLDLDGDDTVGEVKGEARAIDLEEVSLDEPILGEPSLESRSRLSMIEGAWTEEG
jgi:hypothetical protein